MQPYNDLTDHAVTLAAARRGDRAAFEAAIYRPYERQIYSHAYRMMADADDAYDMTVDSFVKAFTRLDTLRSPYDVRAWLFRICTNRCLDALRRRQRLRWLPWEGPKHDGLLPASRLDQPDTAVERAETNALVRQTLARLSPRDRAVLLLREYDDLSCTDTGAVLGISRPATKSALWRARSNFRSAYAAVEAERLGVGV